MENSWAQDVGIGLRALGRCLCSAFHQTIEFVEKAHRETCRMLLEISSAILPFSERVCKIKFELGCQKQDFTPRARQADVTGCGPINYNSPTALANGSTR